MNMTAVIKFNRGLKHTPVKIKNFEYPTVNWKYASAKWILSHAESTNNTLKDIILQCPIVGNHKRILIDVKVQDLVPEKTSCIPGWHLDGPENPLHDSKPEIHHLYIHEEGGETEFISDEIELKIDNGMSQKEIVDMIPKNASITKSVAGCFTTFTRFDFHRGINVEKPMRRLLVRLTETDVIIPRNKPYIHAVGGLTTV
jgi:hypothetical protein